MVWHFNTIVISSFCLIWVVGICLSDRLANRKIIQLRIAQKLDGSQGLHENIVPLKNSQIIFDNTSQSEGEMPTDLFIPEQNNDFIFDYLLNFGNPTWSMFSAKDIIALGHSEDNYGNQLSHLLVTKEHVTSDDVVDALGLEKCGYIYNDYIVYDMHRFTRLPYIASMHCPHGQQRLINQDFLPSKSAIADLDASYVMPHHDFSHLFLCKTCQWWCIEEFWTNYEKNKDISDFLVFGLKSLHNYSVAGNEKFQIPPWIKVLTVNDLYRNPHELPDCVISLFEY